MKQFLISICVFMLIICVDSMIELDDTIPRKDSFPAFLVRRLIPAVPKDMKKDPDTDRMMLHFETIDKKFEVLETLTLSNPSYYCPAGENELELVSISRDEARCKNELRVAIFANGSKCGNDNRNEYNIGYGIDNLHNIRRFFQTVEKKVKYSLYMSCFDEAEDRVYAVKYKFRGRNELYHQSSTMYLPPQLEEILKFHSKMVTKMAEKLKRIQKVLAGKKIDEEPKDLTNLIPFQLVSHEDMILYNWKLTTFDEKNYSFIWTNIAENSWRRINDYLREFMIDCNPDIDVYSGVHDYSKYGYPRYIWKYIYHNMKGIFIIIHNHPIDDKEDYPHLCDDASDNCEGYVSLANQRNKNLGLFYCCPSKSVKDKIIFFKDSSSFINDLWVNELTSVDEDYHSQPLDSSVPKPKPVNEKTDSSTEPSSSNSSNKYVPNSAVYAKNPEVPKVPITNMAKSNQSKTLKSDVATDEEDAAVADLRNKLGSLGWTPPPNAYRNSIHAR